VGFLTGPGGGPFFFTGFVGFDVFEARGLGVPVATLDGGLGGLFAGVEGADGDGLRGAFFEVDGLAASGLATLVVEGVGFGVAAAGVFFVAGADILAFFAGPIAFVVL